jgi:hypothetical protein
MKDFKIQSINYSFNFNPINNVPQKYIQNAEILNKMHFSTPTILPIEQSVPNEIPIVIIKNDFINAQIVICKGSLSVLFPFREDIQELIDTYLMTICDFTEKIIDNSNNIKFCGLSTSYLLEEDSAIISIKNGLLKLDNASINQNLCDIDVTYTNAKDNRYYINKKIANTRIYNQPVDQMAFGFLKNEFKTALLINIDVNNRYAYNNGIHLELNLKNEIKTIQQIAHNAFEDTYKMLKGVIDDD